MWSSCAGSCLRVLWAGKSSLDVRVILRWWDLKWRLSTSCEEMFPPVVWPVLCKFAGVHGGGGLGVGVDVLLTVLTVTVTVVPLATLLARGPGGGGHRSCSCLGVALIPPHLVGRVSEAHHSGLSSLQDVLQRSATVTSQYSDRVTLQDKLTWCTWWRLAECQSSSTSHTSHWMALGGGFSPSAGRSLCWSPPASASPWRLPPSCGTSTSPHSSAGAWVLSSLARQSHCSHLSRASCCSSVCICIVLPAGPGWVCPWCCCELCWLVTDTTNISSSHHPPTAPTASRANQNWVGGTRQTSTALRSLSHRSDLRQPDRARSAMMSSQRTFKHEINTGEVGAARLR